MATNSTQPMPTSYPLKFIFLGRTCTPPHTHSFTWISFFRLFILFFRLASSVCFLSSSCLGSSSSSSKFWSLSWSDFTLLLIPLTFWFELWAFSFRVAIFCSSFWRFSRRGWFRLWSSFSLRVVLFRASFFLLHSSLAASYSYSRYVIFLGTHVLIFPSLKHIEQQHAPCSHTGQRTCIAIYLT